jgi:Uma2 family endonuclease
MAVQPNLMTVEEFWAHYAGQPYELVNGEVVAVSPTGYTHGAIVRRIGASLGQFVDAHKLGDVVGGETGFWLTSTTMRAADVAFISSEKLNTVTERDKYLPFAPDLAVEVVLPSDNAEDIESKVRLYLRAGTQIVWVIYPELRHAVVHHPDGTSKVVNDTLAGEDVLPGLKIKVVNLFPPDS